MAHLVQLFIQFFPQEYNKGENSTILLHAFNFELFIRPTGRIVGVANLEQHKTKTVFIWASL